LTALALEDILPISFRIGENESVMALSVGKLFDVLAQEDCRKAISHLLDSEQPQTQRQLSDALELRSSVISRRMKEIEDVGLVKRPGSTHTPYDILFSVQVRQLLILGAELARDASRRQAEEDDEYAKKRRKSGMRGGTLLDQTREGR
jgi:DNA-binding HxlR family transcriptional regulator